MATRRVIVLDNSEALGTQAANEFLTRSHAAIKDRGRFALALSGGRTPNAMFELLSRTDFADDVDWERTFVFWGDERCVPPDDARSNFCAANAALLQKVPIPPANVHRMRGELEPREGALVYNDELRTFFGARTDFDLTYLGLGPDGHTASLFPESASLAITDALCVPNFAGKDIDPPWRLTLTYPALNASRAIFFLVEGNEKAEIVARVLEGPRDPQRLPAQGIAPVGELNWLLDRAAASRLTKT